MSHQQMNYDLEAMKRERKAKADGMRLAAEMVRASHGYTRNAGKPWAEDVPEDKHVLANRIDFRASEIEEGKP